MQRIFIADVETTGLDPTQDKIVELSFVEINEDFEEICRLSTKVNPQRSICAAASAAHGIIDADVSEAPLLEEVLQGFSSDYFEDAFLIAHNAQFDQRFLDYYWNIQGVFCTLRAARLMYPDAPNHQLQTLRYFLNLDVDRGAAAHSAEGDVEILVALLRRMLKDSGDSLPEFVELMLEPVEVDVMPFGRHKGCTLRSLPLSYVKWLRTLPDLDSDLAASLDKIFLP